MAVPTALFPVSESFSAIGREIGGAGVPPTTFTTVPVAAYEPEDLATWIDDKSLRGSMVPTYDTVQGPIWAGHTIPSSFVYMDTIGHMLHNLFGDYSATGAAVAPNTTLTAPATAGQTTLTVAAGASFTVGMFIQVDVGAGGLSEIVKVLSGASTSITLDPTTPLRLGHASGVAVTNTAAPYVHLFSTQNPGYTSAQVNGQPPSHTWIHRTQIPGTANKYAVQYAYWCLSDMEFTGNAMGALVWNGKSLSFDHAYPAATVAPAPSNVRGQAAWRSTAGIAGPATGGTQVLDLAEWQLTFARSLEEYITAQGAQAPFVFGRGPLGATFKLTFAPSIDETALTYMLANTQPQLQLIQSNGVGGAGQQSIQFDALLGGFKKAKLSAAKNLFGYDVEGELLGNTTNAGNSAGYSTAKVTLTNAVPTY